MIWLFIEDSYYYSPENRRELTVSLKECGVSDGVCQKIENGDIDFVYSKQDLERVLGEQKFDNIIFSPFLPKTFSLDTAFFGVVTVHNKYGLLTSSEKEAGVSEEDKLFRTVGLIIEKSSFTFDDYSGSDALINVVEQLMIKYLLGEIPKAVFLAGIMGTGKTFFAQCLAGHTKRYLVSFNLAMLMNSPNPIEYFDHIVRFLQKLGLRYLLWIDEIEKMFNGSESSEHIKNKLLTFLNDLGLTIKMDAFVVITANDVTNILQKNPEMMRGGRVEPFAKIFMDFLTIESAERITEMYLKKRNSEKEIKMRLFSALVAYANNELPSSMWLYEYFHKESNSARIREFFCDILIGADDYMVDEAKITSALGDDYKEVLEAMKIKTSSQKIVDFISRIYKQKHTTSTLVDYPYVPAEIKEIVSQLFYAHMLKRIETNEDVEEALSKIVSSNIAIGDAGQIGVNKMLGNKDKFSIIIN